MELPSLESMKQTVYVIVMFVFYVYFLTIFTLYLVKWIGEQCAETYKSFLSARQSIRDFKVELQERQAKVPPRENI